MTRILCGSLLAAALLWAQPVVAQTVSGPCRPSALVVASAIAGQPPLPVTDGTCWLDVLDAVAGSRLSARLAAPLPSGVTLEVRVVASGAGANGRWTQLGTVAATLLHAIEAGDHRGLAIAYRLSVATSVSPGPGAVDLEFAVIP